MKLILESNRLEDYLLEIPPFIQFHSEGVQQLIRDITYLATDDKERAEIAFEYARDRVRHSFDSGFPWVTISAEDTLNKKEGICFAKSHLLATLLRGMNIPAGFCYQRVMRKGTIESGYALHGLNAVYFPDTGWFRVDPRGNKPGIDSQFTFDKEKLAYTIHESLGEIDYPNVFVAPLPTVIKSMRESKDTKDLFFKRPESL